MDLKIEEEGGKKYLVEGSFFPTKHELKESWSGELYTDKSWGQGPDCTVREKWGGGYQVEWSDGRKGTLDKGFFDSWTYQEEEVQEEAGGGGGSAGGGGDAGAALVGAIIVGTLVAAALALYAFARISWFILKLIFRLLKRLIIFTFVLPFPERRSVFLIPRVRKVYNRMSALVLKYRNLCSKRDKVKEKLRPTNRIESKIQKTSTKLGSAIVDFRELQKRMLTELLKENEGVVRENEVAPFENIKPSKFAFINNRRDKVRNSFLEGQVPFLL
jgi:hypothetical protein